MIVDHLTNAARYAGLNPVFAEAFDFVTSGEAAALAPGAHDRGRFRVIALDTAGNGRSGVAIERHRRDIDIHCTIEGVDLVGWRPADRLTMPRDDFDTTNDYQLFDDEPDLWIPQPPGVFSIQFPGDGHAPLAGEGRIRKVVLKVADA